MTWIDRAFINKNKGLLTFADLRRRSESEAKREERRERRKNKRRNGKRGVCDESTLVGATPDNNDEGYIDGGGGGDNDTGSVAAPLSEQRIPPTFCNVSPENVLQPGSSRRKRGKSETESRFPGSERSSSSTREENRR